VNNVKLENTGREDTIIDIKPLDRLMGHHAFIRASQWDYERGTYDYKIGLSEKNVTYYIREQGYATEGGVDKCDAVIQLMSPLSGKHYYPHGVEYGEDEKFPENLIERANNLLEKVKKDIDAYKN